MRFSCKTTSAKCIFAAVLVAFTIPAIAQSAKPHKYVGQLLRQNVFVVGDQLDALDTNIKDKILASVKSSMQELGAKETKEGYVQPVKPMNAMVVGAAGGPIVVSDANGMFALDQLPPGAKQLPVRMNLSDEPLFYFPVDQLAAPGQQVRPYVFVSRMSPLGCHLEPPPPVKERAKSGR